MLRFIAIMGLVVLSANVGMATVITYDAQVTINWYNGYTGIRTTTENNARAASSNNVFWSVARTRIPRSAV